MTDRFNALTVVFEKDIREDDAQGIINAIKMLRGVISVEGNVADPMSYIATEQAKFDIGQRLHAALHADKPGKK